MAVGAEHIPTEHIDCAERLADISDAILKHHFRQPHVITVKEDGSLVSQIDRTIEHSWRVHLRQHFPQHNIIGEEYPPHQTDSAWLWSLDPLDGTSAFLSGVPLCGTLIGLCYDGVPVYGIISHPLTAERWQGGRYHPTTFCGKPCHTRKQTSLDQALLFATTPDMFHMKQRSCFDHLSERCLATRYGIDCYAYGLLASGFHRHRRRSHHEASRFSRPRPCHSRGRRHDYRLAGKTPYPRQSDGDRPRHKPCRPA